MQFMKIVLSLVFSLLLVLSLCVVPSFADEPDVKTVRMLCYLDFYNGSAAISDHKAAEATITFTPETPVTENTETMKVTPYDLHGTIKNKICVTIKDVCTILNSVQALLRSYR